MKFDASLNTSDLRTVPELARQIESLGFDGLWTSETAHNPFLPLTHAIAATAHLEVGTSIAVAFPRSPMVVAQVAWDLAAQSDGRFILGLGTQIKPHIVRRFSSVWDKPGPRLREYIQSLHAIWNSWQNNRPLRYDGEFYQFSLMTPFFAPAPLAKPNIPIHIAGVNPYLCHLAGELCEGFHVHPFHSARYLKEAVLPNIEKGAASAGRSRSDLELVSAIFIVTGGNDAQIAANAGAVKAQIAFYASTPSYAPVLELHGWGALGEELKALSVRGRWAEMADRITEDMLHEFAVVAPYDQLAHRVRARYEGLLDRIAYYWPFSADPNDPMQQVWHDSIAVLSDSKRAPGAV